MSSPTDDRLRALAETFASQGDDLWSLVAPGPAEVAAALRELLHRREQERDLRVLMEKAEQDGHDYYGDLWEAAIELMAGSVLAILDRPMEPPT